MAASRTLFANPQKVSLGPALVYAVLEWLLIFMLVLDAVFSYVITKFAHQCGLQPPCLLCSRLDHFLGNEKKGYYWDLICGSHKSEISSLVLCHAHNNLVDVQEMCESCLFSFSTINRSNAETYRLLVGKLGDASNSEVDREIQEPVFKGQNDCLSSRKHCSCCNEPQVYQGHSQKLIHTDCFGSEAELEPLSGSIGQIQREVRKGQDKSSISVRDNHFRDSVLHPLSHVGYTEVKISSDSESEVHFSDGDDVGFSIHEKGNPKKDLYAKCIEPQITTPVTKPLVLASQMKLDNMESHDSRIHPLSHVGYTELKVTSDTESEVHFSDDDYASSLIHENGGPEEEPSNQTIKPHVITPLSTDPPSVPKTSPLVSQAPVDHIDPSVSTSVASTISISHGLEELNWKEARSMSHIHALSQPIPDNASASSNIMEDTEVSKGSPNFTGAHKVDQAYVDESREIHKGGGRPLPTSEASLETNPASSNTDQQLFNVLDLGDAYKLVVGSKGRQLSGVLAEQWIGKDSSRVTEDLKLLLTQLSANRGFEATNEPSPKLPFNSGDCKTSDSSNNIGLQILQQRISLERNESGLSLDGSIVSEIEGESVVDRLKRQVEHDKKLLSSLYKELEEERNASAIASDQAMAMITRLQEEKAALHMEALQSLRMMEEQAEYDNEALHKIDDLLVEKEKEVQDLEAELEFYREKFPNVSMLDNLAETTGDVQAKDIAVDHLESSSNTHSASIQKNVDTGRPLTDSKVGGEGIHLSDKDSGSVKNLLLDFEQEKKQISQCLERLEKTFSLFSSKGENTNLSKGDRSEKGEGVGKSSLDIGEQGSQGKNDLSVQQVPVSSEHVSSVENSQICEVTDLASLGNLISNLNKRQKSLETVQGFLEHAIKSLGYGEEGLKFIQEIASHLGELRKIGLKKDQNLV